MCIRDRPKRDGRQRVEEAKIDGRKYPVSGRPPDLVRVVSVKNSSRRPPNEQVVAATSVDPVLSSPRHSACYEGEEADNANPHDQPAAGGRRRTWRASHPIVVRRLPLPRSARPI